MVKAIEALRKPLRVRSVRSGMSKAAPRIYRKDRPEACSVKQCRNTRRPGYKMCLCCQESRAARARREYAGAKAAAAYMASLWDKPAKNVVE